jgi:TetR/AcrR family transcriptional repressor of nem operon
MTETKTGASAPSNGHASQRILDIAEQLAQTRGFNAFSYADIAAHLTVTKASLHYHFPSKAELGSALIARYHGNFVAALKAIDEQAHSAREKLDRYAGLYETVLRNDRMCLCGLLAAEYATLPTAMQQELLLFFDTNESWLSRVLAEGRRNGEFGFRGAAKQRAQSLLSALEGALLVARAFRDYRRFRSSAKLLLADL